MNDNIFLHISHTDLDGYGCTVLMKALHKFGKSKIPFFQSNVRVATMIPDILNSFFENPPKDYVPGETMVTIIVTDLQPDPVYFKHIWEAGHIIQVLILDHHVKKYDYDGITCIQAVIDQSMSATKLVHDNLVVDIEADDDIKDRLSDYAEAVSKYDLGNWPDWDPEKPAKDLDPSIAHQFFFASYDWKQKQDYVDMMLEYLEYGYYDTLFDETVATEYTDLVADYHWFKDHSHERFIGDDMPYSVAELLMQMPKMKVLVCLQKKGDPWRKYMSMVSRKLLEEDPSITFFICINENSKNVELRSSGYDVQKIAVLNGGNGHPRASGFPLTERNYSRWLEILDDLEE